MIKRFFLFVILVNIAIFCVLSSVVDAKILENRNNFHSFDFFWCIKYFKKFKQEFEKLDHIIFRLINSRLKSKILDFCVIPVSYCDSINFNISFFITLSISILILWKHKNHKFKNSVALLLIILIIGIVMTYFLKHIFAKPRPLTIFNSNINTLFEKEYTFSFPSGHTEIAVSTCTFMFITVRKYWYLYIILAIYSGFYRIYTGLHFPSDILMGTIIGFLLTYIIIILLKKYFKI
ncbi:MAG: phosphatase PAP2 family protein [Endomicrobium sp.]|jgi:undecaprenyl-diphosphatase|nr:phosphatase PAP2 family protein [Endomicrobium sp.]